MRILLCDDHTMFSEALAVVLGARGHHVVGCTVSPAEAIAASREQPVDLCLLDLHFQSGTSVPAIPELVASSPQMKVVVLSATDDVHLLRAAVDAGAHGVAGKIDNIDNVVAVAERVHSGEMVIADQSLRAAVMGSSSRARPSPAQELARFLTDREREVLRRLVQGESTEMLARNMGVRYSTARTHIQNVLTKLGVHSKLEAVAMAVKEGLVPRGPQNTQ